MHPGGCVASDGAGNHAGSRTFLLLSSPPLLCCAVPSRPATAQALSPLGGQAETAQAWRPLPTWESWPITSWPSGLSQAPNLPLSLGSSSINSHRVAAPACPTGSGGGRGRAPPAWLPEGPGCYWFQPVLSVLGDASISSGNPQTSPSLLRNRDLIAQSHTAN